MPSSSPLSRREIIELGLAAGAIAATPAALRAGDEPAARADAATPPGAANPERPRNIVFMVSDGMSLGVPTLTEAFARQTRGNGTTWQRLLTDPATAVGFFDMQSLNSLVTDSSAASSSWGSGVRIFNGAVNMLPDGRKLTTVAELAQGAGRRVGLVTTTTITHATPAGFAACQADRDSEAEIAPQYLNRVDVALGGGAAFFDPRRRSDKRDLRGEFEAAGYAVWQKRDELLSAARPPRVLGVFDAGHLPMSVDRAQSAELQQRVPTLAEMSRRALELLAGGPQGFLLQIEGGRVDHAAHNNDAGAIFREQLDFDDAIAAVLDWARPRGDTLVVITTDHGNSNPGLNGTGGNYRSTNECFARVAAATASTEELLRRGQAALHGAKGGVDAVSELIRDALGVELSRGEAEYLTRALAGDAGGEIFKQHAKPAGALGRVLGNHNGIGWTGTSHTADWAPILAVGPAKSRFAGILANTVAFEHMIELMGVRHVNPRMTPEESRKFASAAPADRWTSTWA